MPPDAIPGDETIAAAPDRDVLALYTEVMGELLVRGRGARPDQGGPDAGPAGSLATADGQTLERLYRAVHDEMMRRDGERPGLWEQDGRADEEEAPG